MPNSLIHAAAERHRLVATALSDPNDRAIINQFADEVDALSRFEITAPNPAVGSCIAETRSMVGATLATIFRPEPTWLFADLLQALENA